jgi:hypothetical protein
LTALVAVFAALGSFFFSSVAASLRYANLRLQDVAPFPRPSFEYGTFLLSQGRGANFCLENRRRFPPTSTYDKSAVSI